MPPPPDPPLGPAAAGASGQRAAPGAPIARPRRAGPAWLLPALALALLLLGGAAGDPALPSVPAPVGPPPAGTLLVADLRDPGVWVVPLDGCCAVSGEGAPGTPGASSAARHLPLPAAPHEILPLPDGRVVLSLERGGALALLDPALTRVSLLPVGGLPHGLAWDGRWVLVTDREAGLVRRFDPAAWADGPVGVPATAAGAAPGAAGEGAPLPAPGWPHAVTALPGGGLAAALARIDRARIFPADGGAPFDIAAAVLPETVDAARTPVGVRVATAGAADGRVQLFDVTGMTQAAWMVGGRPVRVRFAPGGAVLAVALSAAGEVVLLDPADPAALPRRVPVGVVAAAAHAAGAAAAVPDGLAFDAAGRYLAAGNLVGGGVTVVEVASARVRAVLPVGTATGSILWLPAAPRTADAVSLRESCAVWALTPPGGPAACDNPPQDTAARTARGWGGRGG